MELPAGYRLRAPTLGDLDAVADVLIADELGEAGQIVLGADFIQDEWSRVGFDLAAGPSLLEYADRPHRPVRARPCARRS